MSEYLSLILCFKKESFSGKDVHSFVKNELPFTPKRMSIDKVSYETRKFSNSFLDKINSEDIFSLDVYGSKDEAGDSSSFTITEPAHRNYGQVIYLTYLAGADLTEIINTYTGHPNFIVGYLFDTEDEYFQSADDSTSYDMKDFPVPEDKIYLDEYGDEAIDISGNPGRKKLVSEMWLMSCWKMWFGKHFYEQVPKEKLLSFSSANEVEELENEVIHITLYENPFEANKTENRETQQAFRDCVNMDELEKTLK
jgi:hypothetical protein